MTSGCGLRDPLTAREHLRDRELASGHERRGEERERDPHPLADGTGYRREQQENERARGAKGEEDEGGQGPGEICESMGKIDQPIKSAAGLDHPGPPAEKQRSAEGRCPIDGEQHGHGSHPGESGKIEGRTGQEPQAATQGDQPEADVEI